MNRIFKLDYTIIISAFLLILIGLFSLYSISLSEGTESFFFSTFVDQLVFVFVGISFFLIILFVPNIYINLWIVNILVVSLSIGLITFTLFFAPEINQSVRWIKIGGLTIQPSEFVKVGVIFLCSFLFSLDNPNTKDAEQDFLEASIFKRIRLMILSNLNYILGVFFAIILTGLVFLQSSLTVSLVVAFIFLSVFLSSFNDKALSYGLFIFFILMIVSLQQIIPYINVYRFGIGFVGLLILSIFYALKKIKLRFLALMFLASISMVLMINYTWNSENILNQRQKDRINTFFFVDCEIQENARGVCYQQSQSKTAVGAGRLRGEGFDSVGEDRVHSIPDVQTDFIFSLISYKFGFLGALLIITIYMILIVRLYILSDSLDSKFGSLFLIGTASMLLIQFFINIGMNIGITPVGGITLPFISAGGSSLIATMLALSLCENFIVEQKFKNIKGSADKVFINGWNS